MHPRDLANSPTVLYVGVGGGMELLQFGYFSRRPGGVIGVDVVEEMLQASRSNFREAEKENPWFRSEFVDLRRGDALHLPVEDASIDVAAQNCLFNIFKENELKKALEEMSKRQFNRARSLQQREPDMRDIGSQFSPEEQKYIRSFTDRNGIIKHLPALTKKAKLLAVLRYAMQDLVPGQVYSEKAFNQALSRFTRDAASVRRYLVDFGYIDREVDGSAYWLMEGEHD